MHYFSRFLTKFNKPSVNFLLVWTKKTIYWKFWEKFRKNFEKFRGRLICPLAPPMVLKMFSKFFIVATLNFLHNAGQLPFHLIKSLNLSNFSDLVILTIDLESQFRLFKAQIFLLIARIIRKWVYAYSYRETCAMGSELPILSNHIYFLPLTCSATFYQNPEPEPIDKGWAWWIVIWQRLWWTEPLSHLFLQN